MSTVKEDLVVAPDGEQGCGEGGLRGNTVAVGMEGEEEQSMAHSL